MMTAFAIVLCPSHSFPNLMALVAASAFAPKASKVARTANRSRNMAILWLAERHKSITRPRLKGKFKGLLPLPDARSPFASPRGRGKCRRLPLRCNSQDRRARFLDIPPAHYQAWNSKRFQDNRSTEERTRRRVAPPYSGIP